MAAEYTDFLRAIKQRIQSSRSQAYRAVNRELIDLYWNIGREIIERQERHGWGKSVVVQLSSDLRREVPDQRGFSTQNLWFMHQLYLEYRGQPNLLQLVREIPWGQNITIMTRVKDVAAREYYLRATAELGWSRSVLTLQAGYYLTRSLPPELASNLPSVEDLEREIRSELDPLEE